MVALKVSINVFLLRERQKRSKFFQNVSLRENNSTPERLQESNSMFKTLKYCAACNLAEMEFLSNR